MAVKLILIMLATLTHFHSVHSADVWSKNGSIVSLLETTFNANCTDEDRKPLMVKFQQGTEQTSFHANCTDKNGRLIIFSTDNTLFVVYYDTFPIHWENIKRFTSLQPLVFILNSRMVINVSALYNRLGIEEMSPLFEWNNNIGGTNYPENDKMNVLVLNNIKFTNLTNQDFHLLKLDLSFNNIKKIGANTFNSLVWSSEETVLYVFGIELTYLDGIELTSLDAQCWSERTFAIRSRMSEFGESDDLTYLVDSFFDDFIEFHPFRACNHLTDNSGLIFRDFRNSEKIDLSDNYLSEIHRDVFNNTIRLIELDLSHNYLTYLADGLFDNLRELQHLMLSNNVLKEISELIFQNLQNVNDIDLSHNHLNKIHSNAFNNNKKLATLHINNNQLTTCDGKFPFLMHLHKIIILTFSHNNLERIPSELIKLNSLEEVDLRDNLISSIKLTDLREGKQFKFVVNLESNPMKCDSEIFTFLFNTGYEKLASKYTTIQKGCHPSFTKESITNCLVDCDCFMLDSHNIASITCSGKNLTTVPDAVELQNVTSIYLDISNNSLTELPKWPNNSTVTFILASHNKISKIKVENFPSRLRGLDVSHNNILSIASNVVDHLSQHPSLEIILFIGNPFECSCWFGDDTKKFIDFAQQHKSMTDLKEAKCDEKYELSIVAHEKNCSTKIITLVVIVSIVIASVLIVTLVFMFYEHQQLIKVWLFAHNFCLWWVDEEYLDRDKEFDAFISYAQKDVLYVHSLMTELENGTPRYKLFVHDRDFIVGEEIGPAILSSVKRCRRTIIILSKNFIASPWATHEFHCAYRRSIAEKRNCLIVVKHGDIGDSEQLDDVIRSYIQTYTYIESTDKWFWEKIRYALPHKPVDTRVESRVEALVESRV